MSKKDYQAIARAMNRAKEHRNFGHTETEDGFALNLWRETVSRVSDVLASDNPAFDRARFLEACETGTTKGMPR